MNTQVSPTRAVIPGPKPLPLVGNLFEVLGASQETTIEFAEDYHREYGGIFVLSAGGKRQIFASHHALVAEMCAGPTWSKAVHDSLEQLRDLGGDGLFTAYNQEPNWGRAHRLLMPAFGTVAMKDYFPQMLDIAEQMMVRWERFGPGHHIDVAEDMTRLTLDTIALCAFDVRFNSFYSEQSHPFVGAMVGALIEAGNRGERLPGVQPFLFAKNRQYRDDIATMHRITDEIVAARIAKPAEGRPDDLLERMLSAVDPLTGEKLSAENIQYQLATFLIAGHETTSGLLSFATHKLLTHPEVLERARGIVDEVLGDATPTFDDLARLGYIGQILRETLRLHPTAPAFALSPSEPATLGGYPIDPAENVLVMLPVLHRDPAVWESPDVFDPDRFGPERMNDIPEYAWMPFGHGARACIGRPFALQEATLVLAMMLQRFDIALADPDYRMTISETLTIKPKDLAIRATARRPHTQIRPDAAPRTSQAPADMVTTHGTPILVLYGSNGGSSESLARTIAGDGKARGWDTVAAPLDEYAGTLPTTGPVVIVTSSYNGAPPDNAKRFVEWLTQTSPDLTGVDYLVLGCGSLDWAATYQRVPTVIDEAMHAAGARRVRERGATDARTDFFGDWERWYQPLWEKLSTEYGVAHVDLTGPRYRITGTPAAQHDRDTAATAVVLDNRELVRGPSERSKRHLELRLPDGMAYRTGDYLSVFPRNHPSLVTRLIARLGVPADQLVTIESDAPAGHVPVGIPTRVDDLLTRYVDLSAPATPGVVSRLAQTTKCPPERTELGRLAGDDHAALVLGKRLSLLDLMEMFPSCQVDLAWVLDMLPPHRARQYSISSAAEIQSDVALTASVVEGPALSGNGTYRGAASSYLQRVQPGDRLAVALASPVEAFRPPADNAVPVIMIGAGSGIAPFRAFIQARMARADAGEPLGETVLFFGCQHPDWDDLYADEFAPHVDSGRLRVDRAYSRLPDGDVRYVQHRLWEERGTVLELAGRGAHIYVCGDVTGMGPAVEQTLTRTGAESHGAGWLSALAESGRYATDLF
ncbi:cytochrome P450/NADPH-cytochrome P450 reductase [Kibdelosporangium banguiense]|uniref:Bifunctional cytochrome P450/NADPH--P450 reductase n=1 Tax=Kibdelosporangium banguiense TaxID=1365924 RepID=A0ABS4TW08_9PSEU|nr:cytochrome P450 [Kibdelosporangium banguiense]MBP2328163.1 cytochrome P450/NADPH-cytochrome P450 reductase [Kibdelosporangium banguiense]